MLQLSNLTENVHFLENLISQIKLMDMNQKLDLLLSFSKIQSFLDSSPFIQSFFDSSNKEIRYVIASIIIIDQAPIVFNLSNSGEDRTQRLKELIGHLLDLERFYQEMGGIIGYHLTVLNLIISHNTPNPAFLENVRYIQPEGIDLNKDNEKVRHAIRWSIDYFHEMGEMYPVGGSGDRLNLINEKTQEALPAALLNFLGFTLLEGLVRDLQAREYLYYKLTNRQVTTPIALMTSVEKNNHFHIFNIFQKKEWFGRPFESIYFFIQPLVPVITIEGNWSLTAPLTLYLKPCGHGTLWKLAENQAVFDWLRMQGRDKCLVRQINNPLAGTDYALLALAGIGSHEHKAFGFISCERPLYSSEGINVLIEKKVEKWFEYRLTNIEYTDFAQKGIDETPIEPNSHFSIYPANTNILFAHLTSIRQALHSTTIPGLLINMKSSVPFIDLTGKKISLPGGRLESTMQNIADYLVDRFSRQLRPQEQVKCLKTFVLFNERSKTISTTKQSYSEKESPLSTPEQAYYDLLSNNYKLFKRCQFELPAWHDLEELLKKGPSCLILFHPALGPLYSIIEQKIRKGRMAYGSELQLEIAELDIENLDLNGSLLIHALSPLGQMDATRILRYGRESRCYLKNVNVVNRGIDRATTQSYWKNQLIRHESLQIILHEGAEFYAENVTITGSHLFEVPAYQKLTLKSSQDGSWTQIQENINQPSWQWNYTFNQENEICLKRVDL